MRKKLLFGVSGQESVWCGLRFAAQFLSDKAAVTATLIHVAPNPRLHLADAATGPELTEVLRQTEKIKRRGDKVLTEARDFLIQKGFPPQNLKTMLKFQRRGPAADIILEGVSGAYDAAVLGHRGLSLLDALLRDSLSKALIEIPMDVPLWVCRWPDAGRGEVLVCADGSDASLRAADHVGFLLADEPDRTVHVLTVHNPAKDTPLAPLDILEQTRGMLLDNGLAPERIRESVRRGTNPARVIREELDKGGYAAVAVGRSGADQPLLRRFLAGSTTLSLLRGLEKTALIVSH